jgi:hypothetical protein
MAQRDWGGGGDLSGLFGSLIDVFQDRAEAALNRQIRQSEEDQAAQDAETYDQWVNGEIADDRWMAYIAKRKAESAGDSEKLQYWTETERKHGQAIEDGQLESAYQAGDITIHDLISHYNTRMSEVEKNSPEHRENADRYYNLVDKRDADYIDDQSARIVDRIERGGASYRDLLNFYQGMLGKIRKTSPLYSQINRQLINIRQIVDGVGGGSGGGSGGGGSRGGRRSGGGGGGGSDSDLPDVLARTDEAVARYYRDGNVFVPTGQAVVQSVFERFDIEATTQAILNGMEADSRYIENMMANWEDDPNRPTLVTAFGQEIPNTPEMRWAIYNQAIANYDYRAQLVHSLGDKADQAALIDIARTNFVEDFMQKDNSLSQQQYWATRREVFNQSVNLALAQTDPTLALRMLENAGTRFGGNARVMMNRSDKALPELQLDDEFMAELRFTDQIGDLVRSAKVMSPEEILTLGSLLVDQRPENYFLTSEKIAEIVGNTEGPTGSGLAGQAAARDGYRATVAVRRGEFSDVEPWVYVARPGEATPILVKQSEVSSYLKLDNGDWSDQVRPFVERNAANEAVLVYRATEAYEAPKWYKTKNGKWADYDEISQYGRDLQTLGEKGYTYEEVEELAGWRTVTDSSGSTWYVDPEDGMLYERLPFKAGINGSFDVSDLVSGGKIQLERLQGAEGVVMGVSRGISLRWAQELVMDAAQSGEIDMSLYHPRAVDSGIAGFDPMGIDALQGMYWSEADQAFQKYQRQNKALNLERGGGGGMQGYDAKRALASRNEQRRIARIREWYDENDERTLRRGNTAQNVVDDSIAQAARIAGVRLGASEVGNQKAALDRREFAVEEGQKAKAAPVRITQIKPLKITQIDPKITESTPSSRPVSQETALRPITRSPAFPTSPISRARIGSSTRPRLE